MAQVRDSDAAGKIQKVPPALGCHDGSPRGFDNKVWKEGLHAVKESRCMLCGRHDFVVLIRVPLTSSECFVEMFWCVVGC
jgi:hypothetical protein